MTIHWCGTGLSSVPGLRKLLAGDVPVVVWNRTPEKAAAVVGDIATDIRAFTPEDLTAAVGVGDVVVSMLPGDWHVPLAEICIAAGAHFVSSSYISPEMAALDGAARDAGVSLINEVGLDPGIDHLMAHWLVADYRAHAGFDAENALSFTSYCGGVPKTPNAFRYKFSWSPLGVLRALRSPSKSIRNFATLDVARPWDAITSYDAPLATPETFEVYPNRDSLPFVKQYEFEPHWKIRDFVRGTMRLNGWTDAWRDVFAEIETLSGPEGDARLTEMSDEFWCDHAYDADEPDRVVLCVTLRAERGGVAVYDKTYTLDAWGDARGSAMARLVSVPVSMAVTDVLARRMAAGVHAAPSDAALIKDWMGEIHTQAQHVAIVDGLA